MKFYVRIVEEKMIEVEAPSPDMVAVMFDARTLESKGALMEHHDTLVSIEYDDENGYPHSVDLKRDLMAYEDTL